MRLKKLKRFIKTCLKGPTLQEPNSLLDKWIDSIEEQSSVNVDLAPGEESAIREKLLQRIKTKTAAKKQRQLYMQPWKIAAALIPLFILGYAISSISLQDTRTYTTSIGEFKTLYLPDSSVVYLKPNSTLTHPLKFKGAREVVLKGEAFFEVVKNPSLQFIVHTDPLDVKVLGTSFLVRSYESIKNISVSVHTGKVGVSRQQDSLKVLLPNQRLTYNKKTKTYHQVTFTPLKETNESIHFDDLPLPEVLQTLTYYFSVNFNGTIPEHIQLSGSFERAITIEQIVDVMNTLLEKQHIKLHKVDSTTYELK